MACTPERPEPSAHRPALVRVLRIAQVWVLGAATVLVAAETPRLWFREPARHFTESCLLGNGRLGAMAFGGVAREKVVLNELTLWSGSPQDADRERAAEVLPEIRRLLREGKNLQAQELLGEQFVCKGPGSSSGQAGDEGPYGCYQVLGLLELAFDGHQGAVEDYRRELDLDAATARVTYRMGGVAFTREVLVSAPAQVVVVRLTADRPGALSFLATLARERRATTVADGTDGLRLQGRMASGQPGVEGMAFEARLKALTKGGRVSSGPEGLRVTGADEVVLLLAAGTSYVRPDFRRIVEAQLRRAGRTPYAQLRARHVADHRRYFRRVSLRLGGPSALSTPERLKAAQKRPDPGLAALYFQYGRYLLISASRPDSPLPMNLQGLWAQEYQTPWNGDYHLNINLQMAYWPAESTGLGDCHRPLLQFIGRLVEPGRRTARAYYGARGWAAHVITNPWLFTSPGEEASWGSTVSGGPWLCQHLWKHYAFTGDRAFLAEAYPVLKASAEFCLDTLVEEPRQGWLVTSPSNSPENPYRMADGQVGFTCMGPTMDSQIYRELLGNAAEAARLLKRDPELVERMEAARARLAPTRIGARGQVMEWLEDYAEPDPKHRHVSHLYGLYPGDEISRVATPDLAKAARRTLELRGDASTGWSMAWKMAFWARLGDGNRAAKLLGDLLRPTIQGSAAYGGGGTYPNLLCAHPPFQIDGNLGATAALSEMLLQGGGRRLELLPALPEAWFEGEVRGLRAPGGYTVEVAWKDGRLVQARVLSRDGGACTLAWQGRSRTVQLPKGRWFAWTPGTNAVGRAILDMDGQGGPFGTSASCPRVGLVSPEPLLSIDPRPRDSQ